MRLEKWYMVLEGPEYKEGFAFTEPCSKENVNEVTLVRYSSYERACLDRDNLFKENHKLKAQLEKAENCLKLISAPQCDYRTFEAETVERLIECIVADTDCSREYFKEKEQV